MKKNNWKNNLDEMQEQKLLHIERNGCWLAFWGLLITQVIEMILFDNSENLFYYVAGEWILFMVLAIYICAGCLKNGIWARQYSADPATNIKASLIAGLVYGIIMCILSYLRSGKLVGSIGGGIISGGFVFVLCLVTLSIMASAYKKRLEKLEKEEAEEEEKADV